MLNERENFVGIFITYREMETKNWLFEVGKSHVLKRVFLTSNL